MVPFWIEGTQKGTIILTTTNIYIYIVTTTDSVGFRVLVQIMLYVVIILPTWMLTWLSNLVNLPAIAIPNYPHHQTHNPYIT